MAIPSKKARPAEQGTTPTPPPALPPAPQLTIANGLRPTPEPDPGFIDFPELRRRVPYCDRKLRHYVRLGLIPSVRLKGARKHLFSWPVVEAALLRHSTAA